jgi:hypothetical protein
MAADQICQPVAVALIAKVCAVAGIDPDGIGALPAKFALQRTYALWIQAGDLILICFNATKC